MRPIQAAFTVDGRGLRALFLSGEYLSVPASVGLIALLGVAVRNGVLMVSYFEQSRVNVTDLSYRVMHKATRRLRPILVIAGFSREHSQYNLREQVGRHREHFQLEVIHLPQQEQPCWTACVRFVHLRMFATGLYP